MHPLNTALHTRRAFLKRSSQLAIAGVGLPTALNLAAIGEAAAFGATDYKALICVYMAGGSDYANTVVTYDNASYDLYSAVREGGPERTAGGIALARNALTPTLLTPTDPLPAGRQYALHPKMTGMASLFHAGKAAVLLNVGPLVVPLTRKDFSNSNLILYPRPPKLQSHNDQTSIWLSSHPEGSALGWGGSLADLALSANSNAMFTCMSVSGNAVFLSGQEAFPLRVGTAGLAYSSNLTAGTMYGSSAVKTAYDAIIRQSSVHPFENEYNRVTIRSLEAKAKVDEALTKAPDSGTAYAQFPVSGNSLANQLKLVARLIASRDVLGVNRQVFYVQASGGYDLHDNLIVQQSSNLDQLSVGISAFQNAMNALGVADKVTLFTASEFGRTLTSNGDGSDHGWGNHHFVVGGAVRGRKIYGRPPPVSITNSGAADDQWHIGSGSLLPSTSVDQMAATLATWFGVPTADLALVMPNIVHFGRSDYPINLGFLG
ncbi:MAG: DUF1501 domain-containing protein [Rhodoferax sp.]|nr:DUF1501 domain-containing protein [Rhodoferax sp.]